MNVPILSRTALVLVALTTATASGEGFTGTNLSDHAESFGNAVGNALANEIVVRINSGSNNSLKTLIATDALAERLRVKCKTAVCELIENEQERLWRADARNGQKLLPIHRSAPMKLSLNLGRGLKWNQDITIVWSLGDVKIDGNQPPIDSKIWVSFDLPTVPVLGGGDMKVSGGCSIRTDFIEKQS